MTGTRGPHSKPDEERVRRGISNPQLRPEKTTLVWDGKTRGPDLPKMPGYKWAKQTKAWWDVWRNSPQAMVMLDTDWMIMLEIALLVNDLWTPKYEYVKKDGKTKRVAVRRPTADITKLRSEIRQGLAAFGASFEDRQRRGMKIESDNDKQQLDLQAKADAKQIVNYAEMLTKYASGLKRADKEE